MHRSAARVSVECRRVVFARAIVVLAIAWVPASMTMAQQTPVASPSVAPTDTLRPEVTSTATAAPTRTPTPTPTPKCQCLTVAATFEPGGAEPVWGAYLVKGNSTWRIGFRIVGVFTGRGNYRQCNFYQNENGKLQWTIGGKAGEIVGKTPNAITKFEKATFAGDTWTLAYNDALGPDYPVSSTSEMSIMLSIEFEIKCVSSDGTSMSKRFKVEGSVKGQAAQKGAKPTLSDPMITYTPLP